MYKFEVYTDTKGEYRWRLVAANGRTVADSAEGYSSRQACEEGIRLVKTEAAKAEIVSAQQLA
jgi:uncharacterized protein YegP (UPF0339 family)